MRALVLVAVLGATVHAQKAAAPALTDDEGDSGFGGHLAFGEATASGLSTAWVARFEDEMMIAEPSGSYGPLAAIAIGYDYWREGRGTWGTSLPAQVMLGYRAYGARIMAGLGFDCVLLDQVHGDTGFGLYAPLASISAGLDYRGVSLLGDVRVVRRWQFGADDFTQWMFTISVGVAEQHRRPAYRAM